MNNLPDAYQRLAEWMAARVEDMPELAHKTELRFDAACPNGAWFCSLSSMCGGRNDDGHVWIYGQDFAPSPHLALYNAIEEWKFSCAKHRRSA
jgi:hypothetical protein